MVQALNTVEQGFWSIWDASWHAAILVGVATMVCAICGRWLTTRWRFALWLLVLIRLALPLVPSSDLSLFNWLPSTNTKISKAPLASELITQAQIPSPMSNHSSVAETMTKINAHDTESALPSAARAEITKPVTAESI